MNAPARLLLPLAGLLATGAPLAGQVVAASAVLAAPRNSVRLGGVPDREGGWWAGVALGFEAGRFVVAASGLRGRLTASQPGTVPTTRGFGVSGSGYVPHIDVGEISVSGRYDVRPWLGVELGYVARAFSSAAGYQRWDIASVGATASRDLGTPAVRAVAGLAWLPLVRISGLPEPTFALRGDVGLSVAPTQFPLGFTLAYRVERFDFSPSAARSEQFEALTLSVGARIRRLGGRWKLGGE